MCVCVCVCVCVCECIDDLRDIREVSVSFLIVQMISRSLGLVNFSVKFFCNFGLSVMFHILSAKRNKGYRYWYFIGIDRLLMVTVCNHCADLPTELTGTFDIIKI